jgi:aminopeptidase YwaD
MTTTARVEELMRELLAYPDRNVGGPGDRAATAMFAREMERAGFAVTRREFDCLTWEDGGATLSSGDERFDLFAGAYSLSCDVTARPVGATRVEDLESDGIAGSVVVIHGALASEQLMPKNFTFYNPESHKRVIRALEEHEPAAVVAATGRNPGMAGSRYPFPLFEDGDFDIPNAYMRDVDGERLLALPNAPVTLRIDSRRVPSTAGHVVARMPGDGPGRVVVSAHIDSATGSPGALDNASGVATLLVLADLLSDYRHGPVIEVVPFNGEDNYANPGEMLWLAENEGRLGDVVAGINIDDLGMRDTRNHVSFYGCPPPLEATVRRSMERYPEIEEGPQWFQGDHMVLAQAGCPAIAMASSDMAGFMAKYAHSGRDAIALLDPWLVVEAAGFLRDVIGGIAAL